MNIYIPYFYVIQHIASGKYYAGYKANKANSSTFMTPGGYQTSSKPVKAIIAAEGLEAFKVDRLKHFETKTAAFDYETRFLTKVGVPYNPRFLNEHVTDKWSTLGKKFSLGPRSPEHIANHAASMTGKKLGPRSPETIAKIKASMMGKNRGPQGPETIAKKLATWLASGGAYNKIACTWEGIAYPSITAAIKATGMPSTTLRRLLSKGYTCMADVMSPNLAKL